ncbi:MAG: hypothetical protein U1D30_03635 [Planctomycetota bacterium]
MKRIAFALLTSASVIGCQSPGSHIDAKQYNRILSDSPTTSSTAKQPTAGSDIQTVGYNQGHGVMQNRSFRQRVAAAVESHGGALPGPANMVNPNGSPAMRAGGPMRGPGGPMMGPGGPMMGPGSTMMAGGPMGGMGGGPGCADGMGGPGAGGPGAGMGPGMMTGIPLGPRFLTGRTQVRFVQPTGMKIAWQSVEAQSQDGFTAPQLEVPARYNFAQARIYRLKLTEIANRPGLELYPTLEVYPGNVKVDAYLSHNAVPIELTDEDFDQVQAGNFVTKVIYLPDPKFQELAIAGVETLVSTRLDPGVNPIQEAHRRGAILAVIRVGSVDLEMPHSPPLFPPAPIMGPPPEMASKEGVKVPELPTLTPANAPKTLPESMKAEPGRVTVTPQF